MKKTYASDSGGTELGLQLEVAAENGHFFMQENIATQIYLQLIFKLVPQQKKQM